jgi:thioredoxin-related protein
MNKVFLILSIVFLSGFTANAQEWQLDFDKAKTIASQENKTIVLVFQ